MDTEIRDRFATRWQQYCPGSELPITFEVSENMRDYGESKNHGGLATASSVTLHG